MISTSKIFIYIQFTNIESKWNGMCSKNKVKNFSKKHNTYYTRKTVGQIILTETCRYENGILTGVICVFLIKRKTHFWQCWPFFPTNVPRQVLCSDPDIERHTVTILIGGLRPFTLLFISTIVLSGNTLMLLFSQATFTEKMVLICNIVLATVLTIYFLATTEVPICISTRLSPQKM